MLQLMREKTVKEEVRNDEVVGSSGIPLQRIGVVQANTWMEPGLPQAAVEKREHGLAGIDDIRSQGGIGRQQMGQKASIAIAQQKGAPRAGEMDKLGTSATGEPWPKTYVLQPAIRAGHTIEVGMGNTHRANGNKANGVRRAASAAMRKCRGERWELRASRTKSSPPLTV